MALFVSAIIPAAGRGVRMGGPVRKPLLTIGGRPILLHTLRNLVRVREIGEIILVVNPKDVQLVQKELGQELTDLRVSAVIAGGRERFDSVKRGLAHLDDRATLVLVHDAVRPFVPAKLIRQVIARAQKTGAAILAIPVNDTLKEVRGRRIKRTLERGSLWLAQTPQVFRRELIEKAYAGHKPAGVSDDARLIELMGKPVAVVAGSPLNFKITIPEDLVLARTLAGEPVKGA